MVLSRIVLSLLTSTPDANLYVTHKREIGLQFFIIHLSLSPFGIHETIP